MVLKTEIRSQFYNAIDTGGADIHSSRRVGIGEPQFSNNTSILATFGYLFIWCKTGHRNGSPSKPVTKNTSTDFSLVVPSAWDRLRIRRFKGGSGKNAAISKMLGLYHSLESGWLVDSGSRPVASKNPFPIFWFFQLNTKIRVGDFYSMCQTENEYEISLTEHPQLGVLFRCLPTQTCYCPCYIAFISTIMIVFWPLLHVSRIEHQQEFSVVFKTKYYYQFSSSLDTLHWRGEAGRRNHVLVRSFSSKHWHYIQHFPSPLQLMNAVGKKTGIHGTFALQSEFFIDSNAFKGYKCCCRRFSWLAEW
jgi:hypothetical protein